MRDQINKEKFQSALAEAGEKINLIPIGEEKFQSTLLLGSDQYQLATFT